MSINKNIIVIIEWGAVGLSNVTDCVRWASESNSVVLWQTVISANNASNVGRWNKSFHTLNGLERDREASTLYASAYTVDGTKFSQECEHFPKRSTEISFFHRSTAAIKLHR